MTKKFLRRTWNRYSKLGKGRKKKQKWRNPTGRDNKLREKVKSKGPVVSIGYGSDAKVRGQIKNKTPVKICNVRDLEKVGKNQIGILSNVGRKKKIEIVKIAKEKKIEISNLNARKFLRGVERQEKAREKKAAETKTKKEIKQEKKDEKKKVKEEKKESSRDNKSASEQTSQRSADNVFSGGRGFRVAEGKKQQRSGASVTGTQDGGASDFVVDNNPQVVRGRELGTSEVSTKEKVREEGK